MSIGISTSSFYPLEVEEAVKIISENRIECAEIFYNASRELKDSFTDYLLEIIGETGLRISALHPMLSFAEPYMIFSQYLRRFEESLDTFKIYFENAVRLGAKYINLHGDRPLSKLSAEEYCERFKIIADEGKKYGITLCQENVNGYRSADPEFLADMVRLLGDDANFTLDIKQCVRAGYSVDEIMDSMNYQIRHVHISDHSLAGDCLLPTRGNFDFKSFMAHLERKGYKGDYVIEVYQNAYKTYDEIIDSHKALCEKLK